MPVEIVGEFGTSGESRKRISARAALAIQQVVKACGPPPPGMALEVQWQEHELGRYPLIVLAWEDAGRGTPWKYVSRCKNALSEFAC
jgi:hypothetical protein